MRRVKLNSSTVFAIQEVPIEIFIPYLLPVHNKEDRPSERIRMNTA